jgi:hypothetical protein
MFCDTSREDITTGCIVYNNGYLVTLLLVTISFNIMSVKPLQPSITGYSGSIEATKPLDVTCTKTGSRPRATLQWTIGQKDVTSAATETSSYITASDTHTVISDLTYSVGKSDNGKVLACKAVNVAASSGVQTSIALNVTCKFKKYVFILLDNKMSTIIIELKKYK